MRQLQRARYGKRRNPRYLPPAVETLCVSLCRECAFSSIDRSRGCPEPVLTTYIAFTSNRRKTDNQIKHTGTHTPFSFWSRPTGNYSGCSGKGIYHDNGSGGFNDTKNIFDGSWNRFMVRNSTPLKCHHDRSLLSTCQARLGISRAHCPKLRRFCQDRLGTSHILSKVETIRHGGVFIDIDRMSTRLGAVRLGTVRATTQ